MSTEQADDRWKDIDEYAAELNISRWTLRDMVTARRLQFSRPGKHVRFSPEDRKANAEMWREQPVETPPATVIRIHPTTRRRSA